MALLLSKRNSLSLLWYQFAVMSGLKGLSREETKILEEYFPYYQQLPEGFQKEFRQRLALFICNKCFYARGDLRGVTLEMKVLISATAVKLLFGFPKHILLRHFDKILIYPDRYLSTQTNKYHNGEVNPRYGVIVISWKSFMKGFALPNDGVNLGIHEFAHALKIENQIKYNGEHSFLDKVWWKRYIELAAEEIQKVKEGGNSFFRLQASENIHEFFAVSVEAFFEKASEFKIYNPDLYESLVNLLHQDPIVLFAGGIVKEFALAKA
ncbi:zinc-dependent peptidase [Litoribacter ruber]|uniref:zinc-dependent peptidase n=1 Tax=Litoribacter ruber TaxID=702568 RepID=UPI001FE34002|nr:zinc-dependent peptidase [Litoribacter alkaliphilus]